MAKDKGRELRKSGLGGLGERPAKDRSQSSQRPARGELRAARGLARAGLGRGAGRGCSGSVRAAGRAGGVCAAARRGGDCAARRAPAVSGAPGSPPPTGSAPPTPSSSAQLPRPLLLPAQPRRRGSTVRVSGGGEVTHPRREAIGLLPWGGLPSVLRERRVTLPG